MAAQATVLLAHVMNNKDWITSGDDSASLNCSRKNWKPALATEASVGLRFCGFIVFAVWRMRDHSSSSVCLPYSENEHEISFCSSMPNVFHTEPSPFVTRHSSVPMEDEKDAYVATSRSKNSFLPFPRNASESMAIEQSLMPNTPVASNTTSLSSAEPRCSSNTIVFAPATAPFSSRTTWKRSRVAFSIGVVASVLKEK